MYETIKYLKNGSEPNISSSYKHILNRIKGIDGLKV